MRVIFCAAIMVAAVALAGPSRAQGLAEMVFNAGVNFGAAEQLTELCPRYIFDRRERRRFGEVARLHQRAFDLGRAKGRSQIAKLIDEQSPDMAKAMACLTAVLMFGPTGNTVSGVLVDDKKVAAREAAQREKREADRKAAAEARKDQPAPPDANDGDLIADADDSRPDKLTGRHAMRLKSIEHEGKSLRVGCVPCFNAVTTIGIYDGVPYALNGAPRTRLGRYRVVINGEAKPVRDILGSVLGAGSGLISEARKVPGCDTAQQDFVNRLVKALTEGACLAW